MDKPITEQDLLIISGELRLVPEAIEIGPGVKEMQLKFFCKGCDEWHYLQRVDTKLRTIRRGWDFASADAKQHHGY